MAKRRYYLGRDCQRALSIAELRAMACRRLPAFALEFLESGGEDELTLAWNRDVFRSFRFLPSTLVDTGDRHIRARYLGADWPSPLIIAPTGHNNIMRSGGDLALARAAAAAGIPYTLSTLSNTLIEEIASDSDGPHWMQLYAFKDDALTNDIIDRAEAAGYEALVFTTDSNVFGWREWDRRRFHAPGQLTWRDRLDAFLHPAWFLDVIYRHGVPRLRNVEHFFPEGARSTQAAATIIPSLFVPTINWDTVAGLRKRWKRKLIIKGILRPEDAVAAAEAGCDGVVLSNHGGRHLDSCVAPMEILPQVAEQLRGKITIIIDSGFRRGSDVVKAMALGADAVMIGRATLYGLVAGGQSGVTHAIQLINAEIDRVLGQIGRRSLLDIDSSILKVNPSFKQSDPVLDL